jgi:hypothetical protein
VPFCADKWHIWDCKGTKKYFHKCKKMRNLYDWEKEHKEGKFFWGGVEREVEEDDTQPTA